MKHILIIGGGSIGERHLRCFSGHDDVQTSLCEPQDHLRKGLEEKYEVVHSAKSLDEALEHEYDGCLIATPAHTHIPIAIQCANKGVNLLIEKPLSTNTDGIDELKKIITDKNLKCGVAYNYRSMDTIRGVKKAIDDGEIGNLLHITCMSGQEFFKFRPAYAEVYFAKHELGGGAIQDAMTHILNFAEYLFGKITKLQADKDLMGLENVEVEDTVNIIARHGRVPAIYTINMYQAPNECTVMIVGSKGTIKLTPFQNTWSFMGRGEEEWQVRLKQDADRDAWYIQQARYFVDYLDDKMEFPCTLDDAISTLHINLTALNAPEINWQTLPQ